MARQGLSKVSSATSTGADLAKQIVPVIGAAVALKGVDSLIDTIHSGIQKRKLNNVITYAKKKHPELRKVPHQDMKEWMNAFYTLSPGIATNKELGASMLSTVHSYGGNIDLATAKLIADTGEKTHKQSSTSEFFGYVNAGNNVASKAGGKGLSNAKRG